MGRSFLGGGEHTGRLYHIIRAALAPRNLSRVHLVIDLDLFAINDEFAVFSGDLTLEPTMHRIILGHIDHIINIDERVIDPDDLKLLRLCNSRTENKSADTTKTVNTNFNCHWKQPPVILIVIFYTNS